MSAAKWRIPGPDGQIKETSNFSEVEAFLKQKKQEREDERKLLLAAKMPPPPRFTEPAHRAPHHMRASLR